MSRLFHVSDLHFGAEDRLALDWFAGLVASERPDALIVTGDLTMRARHREFAAAGEWLAMLDVPMSLEVGNHDLPYFNLWERFTNPYRRYRRLEAAVERPIVLGDVAVVPLKTTARAQLRFNWSKGRVGRASLNEAIAATQNSADGRVTLVACHHPLIEADTRSTASTHNGARALAALAAAGADAVLSGHVHDPFDLRRDTPHGPIRVIGAGTLSERLRDTRPSFNELVIDGGALTVTVREMR